MNLEGGTLLAITRRKRVNGRFVGQNSDSDSFIAKFLAEKNVDDPLNGHNGNKNLNLMETPL